MRSKFGLFVGVMAMSVLPAWAQLAVETPADVATVAPSFSVQGTAPGFDAVHVWGFPSSGPVFLGSAYLTFPGSRFELTATGAPLGTYPVGVYAHDPVTQTFTASYGVTVTVRPSPTITSGFGVGSTINATALDDAFTITMGPTVNQGGTIAFGRKWPSEPTCMAATQTVSENPVLVGATRTFAVITLTQTNLGNPTKIQVMCGGGR